MKNNTPSELDELSIWIEVNRDVSPATWEDEIWPLIKAQLIHLIEGIIPDKRLKHNGEQTTNLATAEYGWNAAVDEMTAKLKGLTNG